MSELPVAGAVIAAALDPVVSPPEVPAAQTLVCANCGTQLNGEYCGHCGQRHEPHVHTIGHFAGEAFESISHADSRLWRTLLYLLIRPGFLTLEFFAGRRVRYLPPFRLYLVISVLFFVVVGLEGRDGEDVELVKMDTPEEVATVNDIADQFATRKFGPMTEEQSTKVADQLRVMAAKRAAEIAAEEAVKSGATPPDKAASADTAGFDNLDISISSGEGVESGIRQFCKEFETGDANDPTPDNAKRKSLKRWCKRFEKRGVGAVGEGIAHNIPRAMFVFLPLLALSMRLMYWRPKRYYVEHLLFMVHNHAFVFLVLALVLLVGRIPFVGDYAWPLYWATFIYMAWYIYRAMRNVYQQGRALTLLKYFSLGWIYISAGFSVFLLTAIYSAMTF
jgi:hypothetical protein